MKIFLRNWAGDTAVETAFKKYGFEDNKYVDPAVYENDDDGYLKIVDMFVDEDLAVMVKPHVHKRKKGEPRNQPPPEREILIAVDTQRFQQR